MTRREPGDWIRRYRPAPEAPIVLVCLPHAGGSAPFFLPVAEGLTPDVDVLAIQYPGRQERAHEKPIDKINALASAIASVLTNIQGRPLALFGHSMGAIVAFEVAHRLQFDNKLTLERLFVSGRRAPSVNREETIHLKDDEGILSEVKTLQGTHEDLLADPDVRRMIIPALRSDYRAIETYAFVESDALNCPITALVGSDDPRVSLDEVRAWNSHTRMGFDLEVFSGGHFFLQEHPVDVIDALRNRLTG